MRQSVPPPAVDRTVARNTPPPVTLDKTVSRPGSAPEASTARTVTRAPTNPGKTIVRSDPNARTVSRPPSGTPSTRGGPTGTRSGQEPDGKPFGRYRLMLELGRGGMGVVWKAYDTQLKRVVALKQILSEGEVDEEQVQRFMREARLAAKLRHPNIVGVYDVGIQDGQVYFTTDFVSGRSLDKVLKEAVPPKQAVTWVKQVAEALHYAHEQGVIHRDVKPANILVDGKGNPFVMDFGLAKEVDQAAGVGDSNLTVSGALLGTPQYMSPEQASGRIDMLGPPTDQFSLGAMMYEMIAGRAPFKA
ncbi:MAG: serine/threonine-protein kinase, partial [Planctomycetota bacterium]